MRLPGLMHGGSAPGPPMALSKHLSWALRGEYLRMADAGVFSRELYLALLGHLEAYRAQQDN